MINARDEWFVLAQGEKGVQKAGLPGVGGLVTGDGPRGVLLARPFDQVIDVLEMVVERHAADAAVARDVCDGDLVQGLRKQKALERLLERALGEPTWHGSSRWSFLSVYPCEADGCAGNFDSWVDDGALLNKGTGLARGSLQTTSLSMCCRQIPTKSRIRSVFNGQKGYSLYLEIGEFQIGAAPRDVRQEVARS